jgi:hypothetical protein
MTHFVPRSAVAAAPLMTTSDLWAATHDALCAARWSEARNLLDVLGQRADVVDRLASIQAYDPGQYLAPFFARLLQDRIDLVNAHVDAR